MFSSRLNKPEWVWDHFCITPPIPVNLVFFMVCQCETSVVNHTNSSVLVRVWTITKNSNNNITLAIKYMHTAIKFFENYFNVQFRLTRIEFVIMPYLIESAMHSWGLVFFR